MATIPAASYQGGNHYNKYESGNPVVKWLMAGFLGAFDDMVAQVPVQTVHEIGCGEGYLSCRMARRDLQVRGCDIESEVIEVARQRAEELNLSIAFHSSDIYKLTPDQDSAELVVCCEVMEHLPDPDAALDILRQLASPYLLVSVPREPIWRIMNMARGRYITNLGNTPGHIQHWTSQSFSDLLKRHVDIVSLAKPLPWTMALCKVR